MSEPRFEFYSNEWQIDANTWSELVDLTSLPANAREALSDIVRRHRGEFLTRKKMAEDDSKVTPSESRKKLQKISLSLERLILDFAESPGLWMVPYFQAVSKYRETYFADFDDANIFADIDRLRRLQGHVKLAVQEAEAWKKPPGPGSYLKNLITELDLFLRKHTGEQLCRASSPTKARGGKASAHSEFVKTIVSLVYGEAAKEGTIDDAMKDVISRRNVGKLGTKSAVISPQDNDLKE